MRDRRATVCFFSFPYLLFLWSALYIWIRRRACPLSPIVQVFFFPFSLPFPRRSGSAGGFARSSWAPSVSPILFILSIIFADASGGVFFFLFYSHGRAFFPSAFHMSEIRAFLPFLSFSPTRPILTPQENAASLPFFFFFLFFFIERRLLPPPLAAQQMRARRIFFFPFLPV